VFANTLTVCGVLEVEQPEIVFAVTVRTVLSDDCPFNVACPSVPIVTALVVEHESDLHAPPLEANDTICETLTPRVVVEESKLIEVPSLNVKVGWRRCVVTHWSLLAQGDAVSMFPLES
jgi:hypothetical protein